MRHSPTRSLAIFLVKATHSLFFFVIAGCVLQIFAVGALGIRSPWTKPAILVAIGECAVFAVFRFRCPLRLVAERLGAESGQVTDIFLPKWLADRITWIFTPLLIVGLVGLTLQRANRHPLHRR